MRKDVDICINQAPVSVTFKCPHCRANITIDYKAFKNILGKNLDEILDSSTCFNCSKCNGSLETDGVELISLDI